MQTKAIAIVAGALLAPVAQSQVPAAPSMLTAIPNYGAAWIELGWRDNSANETGFEVHRSTDGGPFQKIGQTAANETSFGDAGVNAASEYAYSVAAFNAQGLSPFAPVAFQNLKILWPVAASHEILHTWNETIGGAGVVGMNVSTGFHHGVDIQRSGNNNDVTAARGGLVFATNPGPNGAVFIRVKVGAAFELDDYNHLDAAIPVAANQVVKAGQKIGQIDQTGVFTDGAGNVVNFVDHVHYDHLAPAAPFAGIPRHPLLVFSAAGDRDPQNQKPGLADHVGSPPGSFRFRRDNPIGNYLPYSGLEPLFGDFDIIAEVADAQGTNPDQVPQKLEWWIEAPANQGCTRYAAVRTSAKPYVLFDWQRRYFGAGQTTATFAAFLGNVVDMTENFGAALMVGGQQYPWPNFKHFIVTNTQKATGAPADVNAGQYWNSNAKGDATDPTADGANFAGKMDAAHGGEARFPDGNYTIKIRMRDLVNVDEVSFSVRIENFPPIVCEAAPKADQPSTTTSAHGYVVFNESMDTALTPASAAVSVSSGASISGAQWSGDRLLVYTIGNLTKNKRYTVTIAKDVRDLPGNPGTNQLDGNADGTAGDPFQYSFFVKP